MNSKNIDIFNREECITNIKDLFKIIKDHPVFKEQTLNKNNTPKNTVNHRSNNILNNTPRQSNANNNSNTNFRRNIEYLTTLNKNNSEYQSLINKIRKSIQEKPELNEIVQSEIIKLKKRCNSTQIPGFTSPCNPKVSSLKSAFPSNNTQKSGVSNITPNSSKKTGKSFFSLFRPQ